jgi:hypothetical protein
MNNITFCRTSTFGADASINVVYSIDGETFTVRESILKFLDKTESHRGDITYAFNADIILECLVVDFIIGWST